MRPHFLQALLTSGDRHAVLRNAKNGLVVADRIEVAATSADRRKGLLGRSSLARGAALVIAPCSAIHMFFMKFAIDVAFVDREGQVVKAIRGIQPWRMGYGLGAWAAIELPAGTLERTETLAGDRVVVEVGSRAP